MTEHEGHTKQIRVLTELNHKLNKKNLRLEKQNIKLKKQIKKLTPKEPDFTKWVIKKTPSGVKYLFWGEVASDTWIVIWNAYYDKVQKGSVLAVSYYAFGGGSGNDDCHFDKLKKLPAYYQDQFDDLEIPPIPTRKALQLGLLEDEEEMDNIPYED